MQIKIIKSDYPENQFMSLCTVQDTHSGIIFFFLILVDISSWSWRYWVRNFMTLFKHSLIDNEQQHLTDLQHG